MRITIAALTLSASLAIGGILGTTAEVRAELIADPIVEASVDITTATPHWPAELDVFALLPGENSAADENNAMAVNSALELLLRDRPRPRPGAESATPDEAQAGPRQPPPVQNVARHEDWSWNLDFKDYVRPLYEELAAAGIVDAVSGLRFYLEQSAPSALGVPATGAYDALPEYASWGGAAVDPAHQQRAAPPSDSDKLVTEIMIKEFIAAVEPWAFGLAAVYVLWQGIRFWLDYSRWRLTRAQKRSSRAKRRYHSAPPDAQLTPRLTRQRRLLP
jgi:hypothetical protein